MSRKTELAFEEGWSINYDRQSDLFFINKPNDPYVAKIGFSSYQQALEELDKIYGPSSCITQFTKNHLLDWLEGYSQYRDDEIQETFDIIVKYLESLSEEELDDYLTRSDWRDIDRYAKSEIT